MLAGRKVLVIDDDLRNIFALTSVLEHRDLKTIHAENGRAGIELLKNSHDVDIVLMDIMMPEMDGYETMRAIRKIPEFQTLPIVALTAKAMKGDREKCLRRRRFRLRHQAGGPGSPVLGHARVDGARRGHPVRARRSTPCRTGWPNTSRRWTTIATDSAGRSGAADRGGRSHLCPGPDGGRARPRDESPGGAARRLGHRAGKRVQADAITLDVRLPDMSGWTVLDYLKHDPATRHIPVHVITGLDRTRDGFALGANTCSQKNPASQSLDRLFPVVQDSMLSRPKKVLIVAGSDPMKKAIRDYLGALNLVLFDADSSANALQILAEESIDGIVLDWVVSEVSGTDFIGQVQTRLRPFVPPVIILGPPEVDLARAKELHRLTRESAVAYAPSMERLLYETVRLLDRPEDLLDRAQRDLLADVRQVDPMLARRKILVVDDDLRNIFALTSVFEQHNITVLHAETGQSGIDVLQQNKDVELVLMDIMMPGMDGYEATRTIRSLPGFKSLPIIALTAKAMKGDREKCLYAGASDYVTKPVDLAYLFSVMRVWLARSAGGSRAVRRSCQTARGGPG